MDRETEILKELYASSKKYNLLVISMILPIEIGMLVFSFFKSDFYNDNVLRHRILYIIIVSVALGYLIAVALMRKDIGKRIKWLKVINPILVITLLMWSVVATYLEARTSGKMDTMVFMLTSLTLPVTFFMPTNVYTVLDSVTNAIMLFIYVQYSEPGGPMINFIVFLVLQILIGRSILKLKYRMAERIIQEREYAEKDVMTGFFNRRMYESDMEKLCEEGFQKEWIYVSLDINGLKEINDNRGHAFGDKLIIGASQCMEKAFDDCKLYRIGGDEFVVIVSDKLNEMEKDFEVLENEMESWSKENDMRLAISYGYIKVRDYVGFTVRDIIKAADKLMYDAKARYYLENGLERRKAF